MTPSCVRGVSCQAKRQQRSKRASLALMHCIRSAVTNGASGSTQAGSYKSILTVRFQILSITSSRESQASSKTWEDQILLWLGVLSTSQRTSSSRKHSQAVARSATREQASSEDTDLRTYCR